MKSNLKLVKKLNKKANEAAGRKILLELLNSPDREVTLVDGKLISRLKEKS